MKAGLSKHAEVRFYSVFIRKEKRANVMIKIEIKRDGTGS
jgi:hypothetical protein